jgi:hypothetical protein
MSLQFILCLRSAILYIFDTLNPGASFDIHEWLRYIFLL